METNHIEQNFLVLKMTSDPHSASLGDSRRHNPCPPEKSVSKDLPPRAFTVAFRSLMAKTAWLERNKRKQKTVEKYAALRAELKAKKDYASLTQLPRDASPTRLVNRCRITGRRRAFLRRFQISRITFRELASNGLIPGVTKASW